MAATKLSIIGAGSAAFSEMVGDLCKTKELAVVLYPLWILMKIG